MKDETKTLTSVRIDDELWTAFKIMCVRKKFTFTKLSERAIHLFLTDEEFMKRLLNHNNLDL